MFRRGIIIIFTNLFMWQSNNIVLCWMAVLCRLHVLVFTTCIYLYFQHFSQMHCQFYYRSLYTDKCTCMDVYDVVYLMPLTFNPNLRKAIFIEKVYLLCRRVIVYGSCKIFNNWMYSVARNVPETFCSSWLQCSSVIIKNADYTVFVTYWQNYMYNLSALFLAVS